MLFLFRYKLDLVRIEGTIQEALGSLKVTHPFISATVMGTRSTDPYSGNITNVFALIRFYICLL